MGLKRILNVKDVHTITLTVLRSLTHRLGERVIWGRDEQSLPSPGRNVYHAAQDLGVLRRVSIHCHIMVWSHRLAQKATGE